MVWDRIWAAKERAAHYEEQADRLRRLAEAEPVESIRAELLSTAKMYQELADGLTPNKPRG